LSFSPETNNAFAGAGLFLVLPSIFISASMLTSSKAARRVVMFSKRTL
jgi:hypothetical protein